MNLQIFLNDKMLGQTPINAEAAYDSTYVTVKKIQLEEKYAEEIEASGIEPTFYLQVPSSMNKRVEGPVTTLFE